MKFPMTVRVKGIPLEVGSWEDLDEVIKRYGIDTESIAEDHEGSKKTVKSHTPGTAELNTKDRVLLEQFVAKDGFGVLNQRLSEALGKRGKAIKPALRKWFVTIGLAENEESGVFESFNRTEGRGYRLKTHFLSVAQSMLGGH